MTGVQTCALPILIILLIERLSFITQIGFRSLAIIFSVVSVLVLYIAFILRNKTIINMSFRCITSGLYVICVGAVQILVMRLGIYCVNNWFNIYGVLIFNLVTSVILLIVTFRIFKRFLKNVTGLTRRIITGPSIRESMKKEYIEQQSARGNYSDENDDDDELNMPEVEDDYTDYL